MIRTDKHGDGFKAWIEGATALWEAGQTENEAAGKLILRMQDMKRGDILREIATVESTLYSEVVRSSGSGLHLMGILHRVQEVLKTYCQPTLVLPEKLRRS